jgi:hypothetical protein
VNVCAPWRSACISWAALSSALPSSTVRYITYLLLLVSPPPVSAPATDRARTLRKGISSLETAIAAVGQAYDGRSVRPRCRLLRSRFGRVSLGLHLYSFPLSWHLVIDDKVLLAALALARFDDTPRRTLGLGDSNPCGCMVSLTYGKVRLLLAGTLLAEGYAPDLRHRLMWARMLRLASHLARPQLLRRHPDQDDLLSSA